MTVHQPAGGFWASVDEAALNPLLAPGPALFAAAMGRAALGMATHPAAVMRHVRDGLQRGGEQLLRDSNDPGGLGRLGRSWLLELPLAAGLDAQSAARARMGLEVLYEAMRPGNLVIGNPSALRRARATGGRSLLLGARAALSDAVRRGGLAALADRAAFRIGQDLAATPGVVVQRTAMCELIHYLPTGRTAFEIPVLFVPSQVNKFYIVDLAPGQSLVESLRDAGLQVFALSWRNPSPRQRGWELRDYVDSVAHATRQVLRATGTDRIHLVGMCAGAISAALAAVADDPDRIATFSSLVGLLDTSDRSALGAFVTPRAARAAAARSRRRGVLSATDLGRMFALARSRELFWTPWQRNYLRGETPPANAVLYWSQDATNLPSGLHADLLELLVRNKIATPGGLVHGGRSVDLRELACDAFFLAGAGDHLVPAGAVLRSAQLLGGDVELAVADGGHIRCLLAGNPRSSPAPFRRATFTAGTGSVEYPALHPGAGGWWSHWTDWLTRRSRGRRPVDSMPPAGWEAAPGRYVAERR